MMLASPLFTGVLLVAVRTRVCGMVTETAHGSRVLRFASASVTRRGSLRVVSSLGLPLLTVLQTHGFKATVLVEVAPISRFFGSCRFVFARHHVDARW